MTRFPLALISIALTFCAWGIYGPTLYNGQVLMGDSTLRPFICVGIAYFLVASLIPAIVLKFRGEAGKWTLTGMIWSFVAGVVGAVGALSIVIAFDYNGRPIYVMPLVFCLAPVANTFLTMGMTKTKKMNSFFLAGLILVLAGTVGVLIWMPKSPGSPNASFGEFMIIVIAIVVAAFTWGSYGPILHRGQAKMHGSHLRPLICIGVAYLVVAVFVPCLIAGMDIFPEPGATWNPRGTCWSLAAGTAGAVGVLGIIMAFNFGGKPVVVMPLVFGCAPVVNTIATMFNEGGLNELSTFFNVSLAIVIIGAVTVLVFAPKSDPNPEPRKEKKAEEGEKKVEGQDEDKAEVPEP